MKKLVIVFVVVLMAITMYATQDNRIRSEWVSSQIEDIENKSDYGHAFSKVFGWGNGNWADALDFEWIMYTNSDGLLQVRLSVQIAPTMAEQLQLGSNFSVVNWNLYSWIGIDNEWIDEEKNDKLSVIKSVSEKLKPYGIIFSEDIVTSIDIDSDDE